MENRLIVCISIVGLAWFVRNTFLGFDTSDKSDHEMEEIFRQIAKEQGTTAVQERICGKHKENNDHEYEEEELMKTTFTEDLEEGLCYEVIDSLDYNYYFKDFIRRDVVLVSEDGYDDEHLMEMNSFLGPGPTVMSVVMSRSHLDIETTKYFKTDNWRLCPTQFAHKSYEFLMLESLFMWHPLSRKRDDQCDILHLGMNGGQSHPFIYHIYPNIHQTIVESDQTLLKLASKWMKSPELNKHIIADEENTFLIQAQENSYDSVWVHLCSLNEENIFECPPRKFFEEANLRQIKRVLKIQGAAMFRLLLVPKNGEDNMIQEVITKLQTVFGNCLLDDRFGEAEVIIVCTAQIIQQDIWEKIEQNRNNIMQKFKSTC